MASIVKRPLNGSHFIGGSESEPSSNFAPPWKTVESRGKRRKEADRRGAGGAGNRLWSHAGIVLRAYNAPRRRRSFVHERISPGHVISSIKPWGSLTFCQRCRIVPLLEPVLPLARPVYRPSHCTDSINDAINDSYRYITRNGNYASGIAACTANVCPLWRNKSAGKVAANDAQPRSNRAYASISRPPVFFGLASTDHPVSG